MEVNYGLTENDMQGGKAGWDAKKEGKGLAIAKLNDAFAIHRKKFNAETGEAFDEISALDLGAMKEQRRELLERVVIFDDAISMCEGLDDKTRSN